MPAIIEQTPVESILLPPSGDPQVPGIHSDGLNRITSRVIVSRIDDKLHYEVLPIPIPAPGMGEAPWPWTLVWEFVSFNEEIHVDQLEVALPADLPAGIALVDSKRGQPLNEWQIIISLNEMMPRTEFTYDIVVGNASRGHDPTIVITTEPIDG